MHPRLLLFTTLAACATPQAAPTGSEREPAPVTTDGVVHLPEASRPFVKSEQLTIAKGGTLLQAPARVAFNDGALTELAAPLAGRVTEVHVRTGERVKSGDPLLTLDCPDAAAARTAVATATASLHEARAALERERRMLDQGIGIDRDALSAQTKVAELEAELARAQATARFVGPGSGSIVILRAPIGGTVVTRKAAPGMAVQPGGEALVAIGDPSAVCLIAEVFERDLAFVQEGAPVSAELPSAPTALNGHVVSIGAVVANGVRTAPVRIALDAGSESFRPGSYGRVRISSAHDGPTLPTEAVLIKDGKETIVYIEKDAQTFVRRSVTVTQPVDGKVGVLSGVAAGERVVVQGALLLDGSADQLL